jgi:hypothetical protein
MRKAVLLLCLFASLPLFARDIYKWTNEEGVVIYSDTYREGAERIRVSDSKSPSSGYPDTGGQSGEYTTFEIVQPENDATIRNDEGTVAVGLALSPNLAEGHSIKIIVDGSELKNAMQGTQFSLSNLNRGTHSLQTKVVDADGKVLISSNLVNFHLRQAGISTP